METPYADFWLTQAKAELKIIASRHPEEKVQVNATINRIESLYGKYRHKIDAAQQKDNDELVVLALRYIGNSKSAPMASNIVNTRVKEGRELYFEASDQVVKAESALRGPKHRPRNWFKKHSDQSVTRATERSEDDWGRERAHILRSIGLAGLNTEPNVALDGERLDFDTKNRIAQVAKFTAHELLEATGLFC